MMAGRSPALRRAIAVLLLLLPVVASAALVVVPVRLAERHEASLAELEGHIGRLEQRLATREQVLAELRQLERRTELDSRLLAADTLGVAGATLAGRLGEQLQAAGGWLDSTQVLDPVLDEPLLRIPVRLRGVIDLPGLRTFLHRIEEAEPVMTVEQIALRNEDIGHSSGLLIVELTVVGYARAGLIVDRNDDGSAGEGVTQTADAG